MPLFNPSSGAGASAWQFRPESYGAVGDGKIVTDVVTNSTTTITSASAGFTQADVLKWVMINGGNGNPGNPVLTRIASVTNSTTAVLQAAAGASVSSCQMVYGTDDTSAINQAVSAAQAYALANNYLCEVLFKDRIYIVAGLTQASSPAVVNAQIPVPYPAQNGLSRKLMVTFRGAGFMAPAQYWESTAPNAQGTAIVSMLTAPVTPDPTFLQQSVIGGPSGSAGFTGAFANTHLTVRDLSVWCGAYTNIKALDMFNLSGCYVDGYSSQIFAPANNLSAAAAAHPYLADFPPQGFFQSSRGVGILFPASANNDSVAFGSIAVEGYEIGIQGVDHLTGDRYAGLYCDVILKIVPGVSHEVSIQSVSAEQFNGGILVSGGANCRLDIGWDGEVVSPTYDISDGGNIVTGEFRWTDLFHSTPVVVGCGLLHIRNDRLGPGAWGGQPAVPATTVAQQNTSWLPAAVSIKGGTVSVVAVDGQTVATSTGVTVMVPAGKNITLTYSAAPTWQWVLL